MRTHLRREYIVCPSMLHAASPSGPDQAHQAALLGARQGHIAAAQMCLSFRQHVHLARRDRFVGAQCGTPPKRAGCEAARCRLRSLSALREKTLPPPTFQRQSWLPIWQWWVVGVGCAQLANLQSPHCTTPLPFVRADGPQALLGSRNRRQIESSLTHVEQTSLLSCGTGLGGTSAQVLAVRGLQTNFLLLRSLYRSLTPLSTHLPWNLTT